jgi:hypothetical protein
MQSSALFLICHGALRFAGRLQCNSHSTSRVVVRAAAAQQLQPTTIFDFIHKHISVQNKRSWLEGSKAQGNSSIFYLYIVIFPHKIAIRILLASNNATVVSYRHIYTLYL